jgi:hypothetical protein
MINLIPVFTHNDEKLGHASAIDAIAIAMRDNFSDISFSLAFPKAVDACTIDAVTLCKMFSEDWDTIDSWYAGEAFPIQSKRPMILGMLLQSLAVE